MVQLACIIILVQVHLVVVNGYEECTTLDDGNGVSCNDLHAECVLDTSTPNHNGTCQCLDGYKYSSGKCRTKGTPLPRPDYDSDWILATLCNKPPYCDFLHGLGETPVIVDVQINNQGIVYHAIGFRPDEKMEGFNVPNFVVYIYDEMFINVSTTIPFGGEQYVSRMPYYYTGYSSSHGIYYSWIRTRAWKLSSLPKPDFIIAEKTLRANTSRSRDSFYEVEHKLDHYPGLVVVRARMIHDNATFYANGVGSALNVFYNDSTMTNAYLVYGFNGKSFRVWVDSSANGAGLLCIPQTFGGGTKAERANGGTLVVYSWTDGCGVPTSKHATFDISVNGTEVGAYAQKTCNVGYVSDRPLARCGAHLIWYGTECYKIRCDQFEPLINGTSISNSTSYGATVIFDCNEGFQLIRDKQITCLANRTWSGNDTLCVKLPEDIRETTTMITGIDEHIDTEDDDEAEDYTIITIVLITTGVVADVLLIVVILTKQKCRDFS